MNFAPNLYYDETGSMGDALESAPKVIAQIRAMLDLLSPNTSIGLGGYADFDNGTRIGHEYGGCEIWDPQTKSSDAFVKQFLTFVRGGAGEPEAQKSFFNKVLSTMPNNKVIIHYTDAHPHLTTNMDSEGKSEKDFLESTGQCNDWSTLCGFVGAAGYHVVTILTANKPKLIPIYALLGEVVMVPDRSARSITKMTMDVLLALWGHGKMDSFTLKYKNMTEFKEDDLYSVPYESAKLEALTKLDIRTGLKTVEPEKLIEVFKNLLTDIDSAMALTYNDVLGRFWRKICGKVRFVDDGKYADQVDVLQNMLSKIVSSANPTDKAILQKWIEESHNATFEIREMLVNFWDCPTKFIIPSGSNLKLDDVLTALREGRGFSSLSKLLCSVELVQDESKFPGKDNDDDIAPNMLPTSLSAYQLFSHIPHLLFPGLKAGGRGAMIMAILALDSKVLGETASELLTKKKGEWIDFTLGLDGKPKSPMNWSVGFLRILKLATKFLTNDEITFRDSSLQKMNIRSNVNNTISCKIGNTSLERLLFGDDYKLHCKYCGFDRSFTVFPGNSDKCGSCVSLDIPERVKENMDRGFVTDPKKRKEPAGLKSNWACCNECRGHYAICETGKTELNVRTKCHFCRYDRTANNHTVTCTACKLNYISQDNVHLRAMTSFVQTCDDERKKTIVSDALQNDSFVCARCVSGPNNSIVIVDIPINNLVSENPDLKKLLPMDYDKVTAQKKLYSIFSTDMNTDTDNDYEFKNDLTNNKFNVINIDDAIDEFKDKMSNGSGQDMCQMCCSDVRLSDLVPICGNTECNVRTCKSCRTGWYEQVIPGNIVSKANCSCPYCKASPKYLAIKNTNVVKIRKRKDICWDSTMHMAWCSTCNKIKGAIPRECAEEDPVLTDWTCSACKDESNRTLDGALNAPEFKNCPKCNAPTSLTDGCNHMTCVCGEHWCYVCEKGGFTVNGYDTDNDDENGNGIYQHMTNEHGSWYN
jgi:hypothetical protein